MANKLGQYLEELRDACEGLKNVILCGITLSKRDNTAEFFLVTDKTYTTSEERRAVEISQSYLPKGMIARVKIVKRIPDKTILKERIYEYVRKNFPAASAFMEESNIEVEMLQSGANFYVEIASGEQNLFESGKILDEISKYLSGIFCGTFFGNVRIVERKYDVSVLEETVEETEEVIPLEIRCFPIEDFSLH